MGSDLNSITKQSVFLPRLGSEPVRGRIIGCIFICLVELTVKDILKLFIRLVAHSTPN